MAGTVVLNCVDDDARVAAFEMSSGATYGFVHERCSTQKVPSGDVAFLA